MKIAIIITVLFSISRIIRRLRFFGHLFQLEGYKPGPYTAWLKKHTRDAVIRNSHLAGVVLLAAGLLFTLFGGPDSSASTSASRAALLALLLLWALAFSSSRRYRRHRTKKPLVFTHRMKRISTVALVSTIVLTALPVTLGQPSDAWPATLLLLGGLFLADFFAPFIVAFSGIILEPLERRIRAGFKEKARVHLASVHDLKVIAVTGSYGKTSVKFAVEAVLSHRFDVLATPDSYNTPMGICRVINDELRDQHKMLILEMGMRHPGDIAELCEIARPDVALITSVGVAHLESMGTIEAIEKEKASLLSFVRSGGYAVLNGDDDRVRNMKNIFSGSILTVATDRSVKADIFADQIKYGPEGSRFLVHDGATPPVAFRTRLVGRHNISNILMAIAVGKIYGLRLRQIRHAVAGLRPVPHRLEVKRDGPITVIDDAFNSNPVGARNAIEILGQFTGGRRVIVTPGMIELGERQFEENRILGKHIARHTDLAILVGEEQTKSIALGLREASYPPDQIRIVGSLFEAQDLVRTTLTDGDVVLYENDLPDQFNES